MPVGSTTWARESARLAYFAVAMGERKDNDFLGLYEQANNALEMYLTAKKTVPPNLSQGAGWPLPEGPRRPLSIMQATPEIPERLSPGIQEPKPPAPALSTAFPTEQKIQPSKHSFRQYALAFPAVQSLLSQDELPNCLAVFDVSSGRSVEDAARYRGMTSLALRLQLEMMESLGPKRYLDDAVDRSQR